MHAVIAGSDRAQPFWRRDRAKPRVQHRERRGVSAQARPVALEVRAHRRTVGPLEDEIGPVDADDRGRRVAVRADVLDDRDLLVRHVAAAVPAQDRRVVEREDVRVAAAREERELCGYALTTRVPASLSCQPWPWASNAAQSTPTRKMRIPKTRPMNRRNAPIGSRYVPSLFTTRMLSERLPGLPLPARGPSTEYAGELMLNGLTRLRRPQRTCFAIEDREAARTR